MKYLPCLFVFVVMIFLNTGCTTKPLMLDNGVQQRVFTPCTDDKLCFRDTYDVSWDTWRNWCNWCDQGEVSSRRDFPVTYRTKQMEYESRKVEYIYSPRNYIGN